MAIIYGKIGSDNLKGTAEADIIYGFDGDDAISGEGGNDLLTGDAGDDTVAGGRGNDRIFGYSGNDTLQGGDGQDFLDGGIGNDRLDGGAGNDKLAYRTNEEGSDRYSGGASGYDTLQLHLTQDEFDDTTVREKLAEFEDFVADPANRNDTFNFEDLFDLRATGFDKLDIYVEGQVKQLFNGGGVDEGEDDQGLNGEEDEGLGNEEDGGDDEGEGDPDAEVQIADAAGGGHDHGWHFA